MSQLRLVKFFSLLFGTATLLFSPTSSQNPGIAVRINEQGLHAVSEYGSQELRNYLSNFQIPNIVYDTYHIDDIRIISIDLGQVSITPSAPNIITASVEGASIEATAAWSASVYILFGESHFHGEVTASLSGVSISQQVIVGLNEYSGPSLGVGACSASIESLNLRVHYKGWFSWLISSLVDSLDSIVRRQITEKICPGLARELHRYFAIGESQFLVSIPIKDILIPFENIDVNVGLTSAPEITDTSITVQIAGRCYNTIHNPDQRFSFYPPPLPSFPSSDEMAQGLLSQYVLNTLLYSLWQTSGYLMKFDEAQFNSLINVEVSAGLLADHIPEFYHYIGRPLEVAFQSPEPVRVSINSSGVIGVGSTNMVVYAVETEEKDLEPIVAANFSISATFEIVINGSDIFGNMSSLSVHTTSEGEAAEYFEELLQNNNNEIIHLFNEQANQKKARLILFDHFEITSPKIRYEENAVEAAGSVEKV